MLALVKLLFGSDFLSDLDSGPDSLGDAIRYVLHAAFNADSTGWLKCAVKERAERPTHESLFEVITVEDIREERNYPAGLVANVY